MKEIFATLADGSKSALPWEGKQAATGQELHHLHPCWANAPCVLKAAALPLRCREYCQLCSVKTTRKAKRYLVLTSQCWTAIWPILFLKIQTDPSHSPWELLPSSLLFRRVQSTNSTCNTGGTGFQKQNKKPPTSFVRVLHLRGWTCQRFRYLHCPQGVQFEFLCALHLNRSHQEDRRYWRQNTWKPSTVWGG